MEGLLKFCKKLFLGDKYGRLYPRIKRIQNTQNQHFSSYLIKRAIKNFFRQNLGDNSVTH